MNPSMANYQSVPKDFGGRADQSDPYPVPPDGCVGAKLEEIEKTIGALGDKIDVILRPVGPALCSAPRGGGPSHVWGKLCQIEGRLSDILGRIEL